MTENKVLSNDTLKKLSLPNTSLYMSIAYSHTQRNPMVMPV